MKKYLINAFVLVLFFLNGVAFASEIKVYHLESGQTVVIKEVHTSPIVTLDTWVKTGSLNETPKNNGVAHFLEHLFFKGTKNHKRGEFESFMDSKGAVYNAATSKDFTHYYITSSSKDFEEIVDYHADMLLNIAIPKNELEKERKVVLEEISRANDNPDKILFNNLNSLIFKKHPYKYTTLGDKNVIKNIPKEDILKFYDTWYSPCNMVTIVVGDIESQKALDVIKKEFDKKCGFSKRFSYKKEPRLKHKTEKIHKGDYNSGYLMVGYKGANFKKSKDIYALDLLSSILGDGRSSRLYQEIKEKKQLATSISAGHFSLRDDSLFYVNAKFKPENVERLRKAIDEEIQKVIEKPVLQEELDRVKAIFEREYIYSNESTEDIANSIGYVMVLSGDISYYENYLKEINKITAYDIQKAAKKYLSPHLQASSVILPEKELKTISVKKTDKKQTSRQILENGITLITQKHQDNQIIALKLFIRGGDFVEKIPSTSAVLAKTLMKGTKNKTSLQIANELESKGIIIAPASESDYFSISLKSTQKDFDLALDTLIDVLNNAIFPNYEIVKTKKNMIESIKSSKDRPSALAFDSFKNSLYPNHPYGYSFNDFENNIPKISRNDVVEYYNSYFNPENMVVSVSGNIKEEKLKEKLYQIYSKNNAKKVNIKEFRQEAKTFKQNKKTFVDKDSQTAWMVLGWPVNSVIDKKDYATLKVIRGLLSGGMSSRLFVTFREENPLAYEVGSINPTNMDTSYFALYIGTNPDNLEVVNKELFNQVERLKNEEVSIKELKNVKSKIKGQFMLSQETNSSKAELLGRFETIGEGYDFYLKFPNLINNVSVYDIKRVSNKYFDKPYVFSVVGPKNKTSLIDIK